MKKATTPAHGPKNPIAKTERNKTKENERLDEMKKFRLSKLFSLLFVGIMLIGMLVGITAYANSTDESVEIVYNNVSYGETLKLMYAVKAPEGASVKVVLCDAEGTVIGETTQGANQTINGQECLVFTSNVGVSVQSIGTVVYAKALLLDGEEVVSESRVQRYSVLEYLYKRILVDAKVEGKVTEDQLGMYNALIKFGADAEIVLTNTAEADRISNKVYVRVTDGTIDGTNFAGIYKKGETPFTNMTTSLTVENGYKLVWLVDETPYSTEEMQTLALTDHTFVTATIVEAVCEHASTTREEIKATCTVDGSYTVTCNDCYEIVESGVLKAPGHTEGPEATCTSNQICTVCNEELAAMLPHDYVDGYCSVCEAVDPDYYFEMSIADALAADDDTKVIISGTVSEIKDAWNTQYNNMSVYITDGTDTIQLFRLATQVGVGDYIKVTGQVGSYNSEKQIAQGATAEIVTKHVCSEYTDATCKELATCVVCGATTGEFAEHNYVDGACSMCGAQEGVTTVTASKTMKELITSEGWTSSTTKQSFNLDDVVSVKVNGGSNSGKAYNGDHIRIYATDSPAGSLTITLADGYELVSVKVTTKTGTYAFLCVDGTTTDISNNSTPVSGSSVVLKSVKNGSNGKQVQVTAIEVEYKVAD